MHGLDHPNQSKQLNDNPFSHIQRVFLEYLYTHHSLIDLLIK